MKTENMEDLMPDIDSRCQLIGSLIGSCCVWKRTGFCLTERRLQYSFMHNHPFCRQVKAKCGLAPCLRNDTDLIIRRLQSGNREPFLHQCHAGGCELVIPVYRTGRILGCVLCGPFSTGAGQDPLLVPWRKSFRKSLPQLVELLLTDLLERFYNRYPENASSDQRIEKALDYIAANFSRKIVLADAAAAANLSPSRFSHLFKSICGTDFSGYLLNLRLSTACDMLKQTNIAVGKIAFFTGFASQQHFTAMFKKSCGITPVQYRKSKEAIAQ